MDILKHCCNSIVTDEDDVSPDEWKYDEKPTLIPSKHPSLQFQRSICRRAEKLEYETYESYIVNMNMKDDEKTNSKISDESFNNFIIPTIKIEQSMNPHYKNAINDDDDDDDDEDEEEEESVNTQILDDENGVNPESKDSVQFLQTDGDDKKPNKKDLKREYIEQELIDTESSYYNGLQTLLKDLIKPMFDNKYIDKTKYYKEITSSLPEMKRFHYIFLTQLNDKFTFKSTTNVFNTFIYENKDKFINMYIKFVSEYEHILDLFGTTFHDNQSLQQFLKLKRKEKKPLSNFLILPVQRVPRYILLLTDLKKNTDKKHGDYKDIDNALKMMTEITEKINNGQRRIENLSQCLQIQQSLTGLTEPIVNKDKNRKFESQFIFIKKDANHQRQFFVFSDIIIIANNKWNVKQKIDIRTVDIKIIKSDHKNHIFSEFTMITNIDKPTIYISKSMEEINKFQKIVEMNRTIVWDKDLLSLDAPVATLRKQLVMQKSEVMEFVQ